MGSGGRNPGRGACPKIIYDAKKQQSLRDRPGGFIFFAKINKKMLALARNACYNINKKREEENFPMKGEIKMIYLNSDRTEFINNDAFIGCGNEVREDLNREYHAPTAHELYDFIDSQPTWDCVPPDAYDQLANLCGVGYTEEDSLETLMDRCAAALEEK